MTTDWDSPLKRALEKRIIKPNGCWYYGGKSRVRSAQPGKGYPVTRVKINGEWRVRKLARVVANTLGIIGEGPKICHSCNDPECWNPEHLRWDTHRNNMVDKISDGTSLKGEAHNMVKLTKTQVLEIRARGLRGETHSSIAKDFPVNRRQISRIIAKVRW